MTDKCDDYFLIGLAVAIVCILFIGVGKEYFGDNKIVYLFWKSTCGYCHKLMDPKLGGKWPMFMRRAANSGITVKNIQLNKELSPEDQAIMSSIGNIPGVPYIVKKVNGKFLPYTGNRDDESLMRWALQ